MLASKEIIGKLDRRITLQSKIVGSNVSNEDEETGWQDEVEIWAAIDDRQGAEVTESDQLVGVRQTIFTVRYRNVDLTWRILFESEYYNIVSVQRVARNGYLKIAAEIGQHYVETTT